MLNLVQPALQYLLCICYYHHCNRIFRSLAHSFRGDARRIPFPDDTRVVSTAVITATMGHRYDEKERRNDNEIMRVCRIVSSASTYSSMAWWLFCVLSTSVIVTSDAWLSWLSRRLVVFFTLRTLRSVVVYTTLSTSAISSCYPLPSSVVAMRSPLGDRINCGLSYSSNSLERVRRIRGRRMRGAEREKKRERERKKKRGSPRVFRCRFGKRNRSGETTGSGATTVQRLSSLRTD